MTREAAPKFAKAGFFWLAGGALALASVLGTVWYDRTADAQVPDDPVGVGAVGTGNSCVGTVEQVSQVLGFSCPKTICAAQVLAANCSALPRGTIKAATHSCSEYSTYAAVSFEISATRRKVCYYAYQAHGTEPQLAAVEAWDDQARYCSGTAVQISAGRAQKECIGQIDLASCDLEHPEQSQSHLGALPRACYHVLDHTCEVCCPEVPPDCSDKLDGYPGYECVPPAPENHWACSCRAGRWSCQ